MASLPDFPKFSVRFVCVGCVQPVTDTGIPDGFADIFLHSIATEVLGYNYLG